MHTEQTQEPPSVQLEPHQVSADPALVRDSIVDDTVEQLSSIAEPVLFEGDEQKLGSASTKPLPTIGEVIIEEAAIAESSDIAEKGDAPQEDGTVVGTEIDDPESTSVEITERETSLAQPDEVLDKTSQRDPDETTGSEDALERAHRELLQLISEVAPIHELDEMPTPTHLSLTGNTMMFFQEVGAAHKCVDVAKTAPSPNDEGIQTPSTPEAMSDGATTDTTSSPDLEDMTDDKLRKNVANDKEREKQRILHAAQRLPEFNADESMDEED